MNYTPPQDKRTQHALHTTTRDQNTACTTHHYERPEHSPHNKRPVGYGPAHGNLSRGRGDVLPDTVYRGVKGE